MSSSVWRKVIWFLVALAVAVAGVVSWRILFGAQPGRDSASADQVVDDRPLSCLDASELIAQLDVFGAMVPEVGDALAMIPQDGWLCRDSDDLAMNLLVCFPAETSVIDDEVGRMLGGDRPIAAGHVFCESGDPARLVVPRPTRAQVQIEVPTTAPTATEVPAPTVTPTAEPQFGRVVFETPNDDRQWGAAFLADPGARQFTVDEISFDGVQTIDRVVFTERFDGHHILIDTVNPDMTGDVSAVGLTTVNRASSAAVR